MNEQVTPDCVLRMCVEVEALKAIFSLLRHWKFLHRSAAAALIYNPIYSKEITLPLRAVQSVCYTVLCWRRKRDLNPRAGFPTYSLSRGAPSPLGYFCEWWTDKNIHIREKLAERKGFEPLCLVGKRFSRPPRYDRFDTSPWLEIFDL